MPAQITGELEKVFRVYADMLAKGAKPGRDTFNEAKRIAGGGRTGLIGRVLGALSSAPGDIIRNIKYGLLASFLSLELLEIVERSLQEGRLNLNPIPQWAEPAVRAGIQAGEEAIGAPLFKYLISSPLGIDLSSQHGAEGAEAVRVLERLFGFATALDWSTAEISSALKGAMGENAPTGFLDAIQKLPWNVGVNWAVGFLISQFVWEAYMPPLVEKAARQVRPTRLDPAMLAQLVRRGDITESEFTDRLQAAGYRDDDIPHVLESGRTYLSVSDLQQAYLLGLRSEDFTRRYLRQYGLSETDAELAIDLYLKRAETAGGDQLRAVAQRGFLDGHLTEGQYTEILREVNVPERSISLEVTASKLVKEWGRVSLTVAQVKSLYEDGAIGDADARQRLVLQGYNEADAGELVEDWNRDKAKGHAGLTESQILRYLNVGLLSKTEAYDRLIARGMKAADARFLAEHPEASPAPKARTLSQATILGAMIDGVISQSEAEERLASFGLSSEDIALAVRAANVRANRGPKPRGEARALTDSDVIQAFKLGLAEQSWALRELGRLGYSEDDAGLKVAVAETQRDGEAPASWSPLV